MNKHHNRRGHELNLASGVMFSPAQENARMKKARAQMARDLVIQVGQSKGWIVKYLKRPSMVQEFQFFHEENGPMFARRSLVQDEIDKKGGRTSAGRLIESVCLDMGVPFSWDDVPNQPEPEPTRRVDNVGAPPENAPRIPPEPPPPPRRSEPDITDPALEPSRPSPVPDLPFNPDMTIRELKEWSDAHGHPVPSTLTRKGDIIEWMISEHSDGS